MRILIVEDEIKLAEAVAEGLKKQGFTVDHLAEGDAAFTRIMLYRNEYDAIVLDLMLPGMDGREICQKIRAEGVTTPVLILSARGEMDDKVDLLQIGADDYLVKPFSFDELVARLKALMRRPTEMVQSVLTIGDITLDSTSREVTCAGKPIVLTLKEFALLEYLMRNPNKALGRDDIMDHLWDFNFSSFSNVLDVHVKNLRKKLGRDGNAIITTVRGIGYRFNG